MRAADFLKTLIDLVDKGELPLGDDNKKASDETGDFIPPLQQEIELLKKQAGVESEYDEDTNDEPRN
jgi:hypothetical protein